MIRQFTRIEDALELWGQRFPFYLEHLQIELGVAGPVDYYYIPASPLRGNDPNREISNFHSCLKHFWCVAEQAGYGDDWDQQRDYVLASSYELVRTDKAVQRIFRDAFLRPRSFRPENLKLLDKDRKRIQSVVASRDKEAVRQEMARVLQAVQLSREEEVASSAAMDQWLNTGVQRFRSDGDDGLQAWLKDVERWYKKFRRRSVPRVQSFLRVFAYEAKVSFYHKYANFWISLLPWLEEHRGISPTSKRFMGIWHNQNQRVEIFHGSMSNGAAAEFGREILLPDVVGHDLRYGGRMMDGGTVEVVPDVFCGQVLALHPLSWILLARPELCELVGSCIVAPRLDDGMRLGQVDDFPEYWRMVEAILTAAYLYHVARESNESRRNKRPLSGTEISVANVSSAPGPLTEYAHLRDYVVSLNEKCPCGGEYEHANSELPVADGETVTIPVVCDSCKLMSELVATQQQMEEFFEIKHRADRKRPLPR